LCQANSNLLISKALAMWSFGKTWGKGQKKT